MRLRYDELKVPQAASWLSWDLNLAPICPSYLLVQVEENKEEERRQRRRFLVQLRSIPSPILPFHLSTQGLSCSFPSLPPLLNNLCCQSVSSLWHHCFGAIVVADSKGLPASCCMELCSALINGSPVLVRIGL